jgi:hypothetical protein
MDHQKNFLIALDALFRAFHNTNDQMTRIMLSRTLAEFPGYVWCPESHQPFVFRAEDAPASRVFLRTPDDRDESLELAGVGRQEMWNPPRKLNS